MRTTVLYLIGSFVLLWALGCSGNQPVTPFAGDGSTGGLTTKVMESSEPNSAFLGLYQIDIDTSDLTWSIEPIRASSSTDVLESVDITGFLTSVPCRNCVRIFNVGIDSSSNLVMGLGIKHPFSQGDPGLPITGRNRADLHIFNIEGTVLSDKPEIVAFPTNGLDFATGYLENPDGYTAYLDSMYDNIVPTLSDGHPYILHFDDYTQGNFSDSNTNGFADILNPTGNLVMKMGSDYSVKDYKFGIEPGEEMSFAFAVGCTYGFTTTSFLDRFNPVYQCPQHNKKAASEVHVEVVSNNLKRANLSSSAKLRIEVMDINHNATAGSAKDQMAYESKVSLISVEAPAVSNEVQVSNPTPLSGNGRTSPLVYEVTITNTKDKAREGKTPCLVKIKDSYLIRSNPNPALNGADAMGRSDPSTMTLMLLNEFATYQMVELDVQACDGVSIHGSTPVDLGVDYEGNNLILFADKQVWKYDVDFCTGKLQCTINREEFASVSRLDAQSDGRIIAIGPPSGC